MSEAAEEWVRARVAAAADAAPTPRAGALLATVTGARMRDAAARVAVEAARAARGVSVGWDEVYEALFNRRIPEGALSGAEAAFYYCATGEPWPPVAGMDSLMVLWTCQGCLHRVADTGPWEGPHAEAGHAGDCPRHAAELISWQRHDVAADDDATEEP